MADTADSKSAIRRYVRVQVPPRAPFRFSKLKSIVKILRCAARCHALAVWRRYAPPRCARRPNALRAAQRFKFKYFS